MQRVPTLLREVSGASHQWQQSDDSALQALNLGSDYQTSSQHEAIEHAFPQISGKIILQACLDCCRLNMSCTGV